MLPGEGTYTRLAMAKSHVGLRWVGGHWVGWVGSLCVLVLLAGNTAKNSIKKQKGKSRLGRGGGEVGGV